MIRLFSSYSHHDEALRNELEKHLSSLKHQGLIGIWNDREIDAGKEWASEISENLELADIILLLVSPDFIDSDYINDIELRRAMERHDKGEARVIPVILRHCHWQGLRFGRLLALPKDGKPVKQFPDHDEAFSEITKAIENVAKKLGTTTPSPPQTQTKNRRTGSDVVPESTQPSLRQEIRSSNLRVKKPFTDHEKDQFLDAAFEYIATYFENSLAELKNRTPVVDTRFRRIDSNHFSASVYINGRHKSGCRVWIGGHHFANTIGYARGESGDDSTYNEMLRAEDNGYSLFLKPQVLHFQYSAGKEQLTNQGGAEYLWSMFIEPLQQ